VVPTFLQGFTCAQAVRRLRRGSPNIAMEFHGAAATERTAHPSPPRPSLTTMANGME
jgi:hypothetical protein